MLLPRWNRDRITQSHLAFLPLNPHPSIPVRDVINLLRDPMKMLLRRAARLHPRFRQALITNFRIAMRQQLPYLGSILRDERRHLFQIRYVHAL